MNVLAVDPGKMTGAAVWSSDRGLIAVGESEFYPFLKMAEEYLKAHGSNAVVVCEAYIISAQTLKKTRQTWSLEVIGALRYLAEKHGATFAGLQAAAHAKKLITDDRLRTLGWWTVGKEHGRDATRHLAYYLLVNDLLDPDLLDA